MDKDTENDVKNFIEVVNNKFKDEKILKKYNNHKSKIEKIFDCPIEITMDFAKKFNMVDNNKIDEGTSEDFWNYHNTVLRELNELGINLEEKKFYFSSDVVDYTIPWICTRLDTIQTLSEQKEKPITLQINTFGGDAYGMFGIIDVMNTSKVPINTLCYGQVMSAGAIILACGKHRVMSKNSYMMIHDLNSGNLGSYKNLKNDMKHIDHLQAKTYKILESVSNKDAKWWEEKLQRELYLTPEEALELELIDEIL